MMKVLHFAAGALAAFSGASLLAQEDPLAPATGKDDGGQVATASGAWLGLSVAKPDDMTATHLPSLPPGIGFVVIKIVPGSPAEKAGLRKHDLLWKFNDQMLVNEGQLATLLRLAEPGDNVTLATFREGKPLDLKVKLGEVKENTEAVIRDMLNDSVIRGADGAVRTVSLKQKKAVFSNKNGTAEVYRVEKGDAVRIVGPEGGVIYEGVVKGRPELSMVPKEWRRQVCALRRGLDHAISAKAAPKRQPRPRIVPPPAKDSE